MKKIKHLIEYTAAILILPFLIIIPYKIRIKIGGFLGLAVYYFYKKRRIVAFNNISSSFPDENTDWHQKICRESFRHFGITAMEFIQLRNVDLKFIHDYISIEGEEHIREALGKGRGIIGICPHLGNWEFVAAAVALKGYPVSVIMKRQSNRYINNLIEKIRLSFKIELIYKNKAGMPVLKALKRNRIVAFVADQDAGKGGIFVNFFGRPASTAQGPARFAISFKSPAMIFTGIRTDDGKFKIIISPVLKFNHKKGNEIIYENTCLWAKIIEDFVKKFPEQYFWMHRRWKTKDK
ncbi:MAG: lysophospholipid acyltransferase family protein [Spirochaetota bacterium]